MGKEQLVLLQQLLLLASSTLVAVSAREHW
jgi:hypothetical protein